MSTKVRFVSSSWMPRYKDEVTGMLRKKTGNRVQDGVYEGRVDVKRLCQDLAKVISELEGEGYTVTNISEITSGIFNYKTNHQAQSMKDHAHGWGWGYGYGYSFTEGLIVTAERK